MPFHPSAYANFVAQDGAPRERLVLQYLGGRDDFDVIIVGSGIGGGILADDLADRHARDLRILVLEAGSFLYPTHVYNFCRFPNSSVAKHYACDTFWQAGGDTSQQFIGEKPQLNFGGRSLFWSGLIPSLQPWELAFFPDQVRRDLQGGLLDQAGRMMNESRSLGATASAIVSRLQQSSLANDFTIQETPRALHQPYLAADGTPTGSFFTESTGVFNTAELLVNQVGLTPGLSHGDHAGLHLLLNHFVEDVQPRNGHYAVVARNTLSGQSRVLTAPKVILAGGSIESPKLLRRSDLFATLPASTQHLVGRGLTDHPTTSEVRAQVTHLGDRALGHGDHAKIIFYSLGKADGQQVRYPFNVEMNLNHEYWHLRENDRGAAPDPAPGTSLIDLKFSFGNALDENNEIRASPSSNYVPEIAFRNQRWVDYLAGSRFPALAGWSKNPDQIWAVLNDVTHRILSQFHRDGHPARPIDEAWFGQQGQGFGYGTVHHAVGSLRMPYRPRHDSAFAPDSVVTEDLRVVGTTGVYVCDMSVMPFSSAANPVRTLAALSLRLSRHLAP